MHFFSMREYIYIYKYIYIYIYILYIYIYIYIYINTCLKRPLKTNTQKLFFKTDYRLMQVKILQNAPKEHSAILLTFIKIPFVFKTFDLSIFE